MGLRLTLGFLTICKIIKYIKQRREKPTHTKTHGKNLKMEEKSTGTLSSKNFH